VTKVHTQKITQLRSLSFKNLNATKLKSKSQCGEKKFLFWGIFVIFPRKKEVMTKYSLLIFSILAKFCTKTC
jgi:hypothetical protein